MGEDDDPANGKQVIARAAAVLRALERQPGGLSLAQLARATALPRTTVQRLVAALEAQQLVATMPRGIGLGPALARLAASAHTDLIALARPHLEKAGRQTRETVNLSVMRGDHAVLVDQYASDQELRVVSPVGAALPLHCTAHGKALLALLDDDAVRRLLPDPLERRTPRTIDGIGTLIARLGGIRQDGLAEDHGEHAEGVVALGLALDVPGPERYALSIAVPEIRFAGQRAALVAALRSCATAIETGSGAA